MSENIENPLLEHLKRFQAGQDRIERKLEEVNRRLSNLETGQASIVQHIGHLASVGRCAPPAGHETGAAV
jgi:hypothetical protein